LQKVNAVARVCLLLEVVLIILSYVAVDGLTVSLLSRAGLLNGALPVTLVILIVTTVSLVFVLLATGLAQKLRGRGFLDYGMGKDIWPSLKVISLLAFWSLILQVVQTLAIEKPAGYFFHIFLTLPPIKSVEALLYFLVVAFVGGGFREELFYRAYLMGRISEMLPRANWSLWVAAAIQISLFAYGHVYQGFLGVFETILTAIIFTLIYVKTRSLWNAVLFHSFFDVWGILAIYLGW
jgi:uncharacterized protein